MWRLLAGALAAATAVAAAVVALSGDDPKVSRSPEGPTATSVGEPTVPTTRRLSQLGEHLSSDYEVVAIERGELPNRRRLVTGRGGPSRVSAIDGLRVALARGTVGFIYRYGSRRLAVKGAESFLGRNGPTDGVYGCGRNVFFTRATGPRPEAWRATVQRYLERNDAGCRSESFAVIA